MRALLTEKEASTAYPFIDGLHESTHCFVRHNRTVEECLCTMEQVYFDLILVTMNEESLPAPRIVELIWSRADQLHVRRPYVIPMFRGCLSIPDALKCREMGAMCEMGAICLRRDLPQAVYEEAKLAFWKRSTKRYPITIRVEFRNGHHFLYLGSSPVRLELGDQLTRFAVLLLNSYESCTVGYLADELSICLQSVKKYFCDLRRIFAAHVHPNLGLSPESILWMEKRPGGTVCGAKVNVVWS